MRHKNTYTQFIQCFALVALFLSTFTTVEAGCKYERIIDAEETPVGILLNWSTCQEKDNSMFIVEKSTDGLHFENLGAVKGAGNSTQPKEYSFLDVDPTSEKMFYRLRQINYSGTYHFSEILNISRENSNHFRVTKMSAVAATTEFEVSINSRIESDLSYTLLNWKGNVIHSEEMPLVNGMNTVSVDLTGLPNAIYRLELQVQEEIETLTFKKIPDEDPESPSLVKGKNCENKMKLSTEESEN